MENEVIGEGTYETPVQVCQGIVYIWLANLFGSVETDRTSGIFTTTIGPVRVHTEVVGWRNLIGQDDAVIRNWAFLARHAEVQLGLVRFLAEHDRPDLVFGGFGLDKNGDVYFQHTLVGSTCDQIELRSSVVAVANYAHQYHDEILANAGLRARSALNE